LIGRLDCCFDELSFGVQSLANQPLATDRQDGGVDCKLGRSGVGPATPIGNCEALALSNLKRGQRAAIA
jgi:hypothetical protein